MNRNAFLISIGLTAFILMAVGGIVYSTRASARSQADAAAVSAGIDPAVQQAFNDREAAYQNLIAEANARLEEAQKQEQALQDQLAALQAQTSPVVAQTTITPEQAASIASQYLGQTNIYSVETVTIQGQNLYKVTFSSGDLVYVNMDGQVVGAVSAPVIAGAGTTGSHGESEHEHENCHYD